MTRGPAAILAFSGLFFSSATYLYFDYLRLRRNDSGFWASVSAAIGWCALTLGVVVRWAALGRMPVGSIEDSAILVLWLIASGYMLIESRWKLKAGGAFLIPLVTVGVFFTLIYPVETQGGGATLPLPSPWLVVHIGAVFIGYGAFCLAALAALLYLLQERELKAKKLTFMHFSLPSLSALDRLATSAIGLGFPAMTLGIVCGAVGSKQVWGSYFLWDPKMTFALCVWAFYGLCLFGRKRQGWGGRRYAILTLVGFFAVVFNYVGLSFVADGLHRF